MPAGLFDEAHFGLRPEEEEVYGLSARLIPPEPMEGIAHRDASTAVTSPVTRPLGWDEQAYHTSASRVGIPLLPPHPLPLTLLYVPLHALQWITHSTMKTPCQARPMCSPAGS